MGTLCKKLKGFTAVVYMYHLPASSIRSSSGEHSDQEICKRMRKRVYDLASDKVACFQALRT